jgi:hypothetical protein
VIKVLVALMCGVGVHGWCNPSPGAWSGLRPTTSGDSGGVALALVADASCSAGPSPIGSTPPMPPGAVPRCLTTSADADDAAERQADLEDADDRRWAV